MLWYCGIFFTNNVLCIHLLLLMLPENTLTSVRTYSMWCGYDINYLPYFLVYKTIQSAFILQATFTHTLIQHIFISVEFNKLHSAFFSSITHIHTPMDRLIGNVGFSVLPKSTWTCGPGRESTTTLSPELRPLMDATTT